VILSFAVVPRGGIEDSQALALKWLRGLLRATISVFQHRQVCVGFVIVGQKIAIAGLFGLSKTR
jgi:hypothetical protein